MLERLEIRDLRVIESAAFELATGGHWIFGANGAGKTTLLESISLLSSGRSFRPRSAGALVRFGAGSARVAGRQALGPLKVPREVEVARGRRGLVVDGQPCARLEAARTMPLVLLSGDGVAGLTASPEERRRQFFGLMFHVEPRFIGSWRKYRGALQQRNSALAARDRSFSAWDEPLADAGEQVVAAAQATVAALLGRLAAPVAALGLPPVGLTLETGYAGALRQALRNAADSDRQRGFTSVGPHRLDVRIDLGGAALGPHASGGQVKRVAGALLSAQARLMLECGLHPVVLVDDLSATLDARGVGALVALLRALPVQWFATMPEPAGLDFSGARVFHVEQGRVSD